MKFSEAVIKGYKTNGGRQCVNQLINDSGAMCVMGAANTGSHGVPGYVDGSNTARFYSDFKDKTGFDPVVLNNKGMDWRDIVGIAIAEGL